MKLLRVISFAILFIFISATAFTQKLKSDDDEINAPKKEQSNFNCGDAQNAAGCNLIRNNNFQWHCTTCDGTPYVVQPCYPCNLNTNPACQIMHVDPFGFCLIPEWENATGTPQLMDPWFYPPTPLIISGSYATYMWTKQDPTQVNRLRGEGLAQQIKSLDIGHRYLLSFYKQHYDGPFDPPLLENFDVVAMHCEDYHQFVNPGNNDGYAIPDIPSVAQTIYCEQNSTTVGWERNVATFTANERFNLLWIRPAVTPDYWNTSDVWFAYPELIDITDFNAGPSPVVSYPNCSVTIGPSHPNCYPYQAQFFWTGPQGQIVQVTDPTHQEITVDASTGYGTWTLHMQIPHLTANNIPTLLPASNTCSNNTDEITASVNVPPCLPPGVMVIEVPPLETVIPKDIVYDDNGNSLIAYTSVDDIDVSPDDQEIGVGLLKMNPSNNNLSNKVYKLAGKKLYVKNVLDGNGFYYVLAGVKDGVTCNCNNQKILILKIDKNNGSLAGSFKVEGYYPTSFHEPVIMSWGGGNFGSNTLFIISYGYDEGPSIANSKIYLTTLDLTNNVNKVYEFYDDLNSNAIIKPTKYLAGIFNSNNNQVYPYPYVYLGCTYSGGSNQSALPLFFYGGNQSQGNSVIFQLDNSSVEVANFSTESTPILTENIELVAQTADKKVYFLNSPLNSSSISSHVYYNSNFMLAPSCIHYELYNAPYYNYFRYVNGSMSGTQTMYLRLNFDRQTYSLYPSQNGLDLNVYQSANENIYSNDIDPDYNLPGNTIALKYPLSRYDLNKFYKYQNQPSACDIPVSFQEINGNVTRNSNGTKMHISASPIQVTPLSLSQSSDLPIIITSLCYDIGAKTVYDDRKIIAERKTYKNAVSIELYNSLGQLMRKTNDRSEVEAILSLNKPSAFLPSGIYFLRIGYYDKSFETVKRFLR